MNAEDMGRLAAQSVVKNVKQANLARLLGRAGSRFGSRAGKWLGKGLGWATGKGLSLGARAAKGVAHGAAQGTRAVASGVARRAPQVARQVSRAAQPMAKKPFSVGLPTMIAGYTGAEGLYSLGQGGESLGKQWDQSITKGRYQGGYAGQAKEYLKRLALRPASTLYGTAFGFQRPGVSTKDNPGEWRVGPGGKVTRTVTQEGVKPYWMLLKEKQFQQAEQAREQQFLRQKQELEQKLQELEASRGQADAAQKTRQQQLEEMYREQGLPREAGPETRPGPAEKQLDRYQKLRHRRGEVAGTSGKKKPEEEGSQKRPASPRRPSGGLGAGSLLLAGVPAAAAMASSRSKDDEEEKLRQALRRYYQA